MASGTTATAAAGGNAAPATGGSWYAALGSDGRHAFWAAFVGVALAAFDLFSFTFVLDAIRADLGLSAGQVGFLATASLVAAAVGGIIAGGLADRIGRVRTMQLTILAYAVGSLLCGLAQDYWQLLLFRVLLGLGYGGDWSASSLLMAEYAQPATRGRVLGALVGAAPVGNIVAAAVAAVLAGIVAPDLGWRIIFLVGLAPALLAFVLRREVKESPVYRAARAADAGGRKAASGGGIARLLGAEFRWLTLGGVLLATGAMSGLYVVLIWGPTFMRSREGFTVEQVSLLAILFQIGSWAGFMAGGYAQDALGRKRSFALFAILAALSTWGYVGFALDGVALAAGGIVVGFTTSAVVSGLGAYLAELFPVEIRGIGQGTTYSVGRAMAAVPITVVGDLASGIGIGRAIGFSAVLFVLCLVALLILPETKGKDL